MRFIAVFTIAMILAMMTVWLALRFHVVRKPTPDQLYGCTMEQQLTTPNKEDCP